MAKRTVVAKVATQTPVVARGANVEYILPELEEMLPQYELIRDCIAGQKRVKDRGIHYLPMPDAADTSTENLARYSAYLKRAVFYNVTKRTLSGLTGQVFIVPPLAEVPTMLDPVIKDTTGTGLSVAQLAEACHTLVTAYGRAGLLVDHPKVEGAVSRADQLSGRVRPTINLYAPWDIINWRTITVGSDVKLSLVVLRETYIKSDDGFEQEKDIQYRVLRLVDGLYVQEIWRNVEGALGPIETITPLDSAGKRLDEIPFTFVGSANNDTLIDPPPLYDLAELNIAHYRNSADYEESVFIVGQPTPVVTGLTENWYKEVLEGKLGFGSRGGIPLPEGASATLLQMQPNAVAKEAMEHKEAQMVALGAKLVEQKTVQRTAKEASMEETSELSTLTTITNNVSSAFKWALEWCGLFAGAFTVSQDAKSEVIGFELNTDFDFSTATPEEIRGTIEAWVKEALTFSEMRAVLRKAGKATLDDDAAKKEIAENPPIAPADDELAPDDNNPDDNDADE